MASITSWMRLEPRSRRADMSAGLQARIYDPLWLLARQWQVGEFQGEDNGSPASARWRGDVAPLTRYFAGALANKTPVEGLAYDGGTIPLETLVERERVRPAADEPERMRFAAEAGQHFLRMLDQQLLSRSYHDLFKSKYAFPALDAEQRAALDADSQSFLALVAPRVPDGRQLYAALSTALPAAGGGALPAELPVAPPDAAHVRETGEAWLRWYESFFSEPGGGGNPAWIDERLEYNFSVAARMRTHEKVLTAPEYYSGQIDWHDFNVNDGASLGADTDTPAASLTRTTIPAPVSYRGMPAPRFWEFEDAQVDFGAVEAGPEELARMLLVEFAVSYGNDWFVIPVELPVGSLCRTQSLVVTNTFGERTLIGPSHKARGPAAVWRMFQLASTPRQGRAPEVSDENATLFFLPPSLLKSLEGRPSEDVLFMRDEMANMAWGIERVIESVTERPLNRYEQQRVAPAPATPPAPGALAYCLATDVPDYWIPMLPVRTDTGLLLKRGKMLNSNGSPEPVTACGRVLNPEPPPAAGLAVPDEEFPREGLHVTRQYQLARWLDGATHLWMGRRKGVGRGEGSSGLRFDTLEPS
jgi:hypothetical protein